MLSVPTKAIDEKTWKKGTVQLLAGLEPRVLLRPLVIAGTDLLEALEAPDSRLAFPELLLLNASRSVNP